MSSTYDQFKIENVFNVKNKVALITGGGSGIGLMAAQTLAVSNGAKVYLVGSQEEKLEQTVEAHKDGISGELIALQGDLTDKDGIKRVVKDLESREDCLCILINNTGDSSANQKPEGSTGEELRDSLFEPENATFEDWTDTYRTNVAQGYFITTAFLPMLQKARKYHNGFSGTVVNIGSISGIVQNSQNHFPYNASKAAEHHLTKLLASEMIKQGVKIRINAIAPGVFPVEDAASKSKETPSSEVPQDKKAVLPDGSPSHDRDIAGAILFAAANQYLNGQIVVVDGGYLLPTDA